MSDQKLSQLTELGAAPATGDLLYIDHSSTSNSLTVAHLFTSPAIVTPAITTGINDVNTKRAISIGAATTAVNNIKVNNAATTFSPLIQAEGTDTNINLQVQPKGTGTFQVLDGADASKGVLVQTSGGTTSTATTLIASQTANRSITLPDATTTLVGTGTTNTLTNKRITRRVITTTQSATPTINTDNTDMATITALAQAITSMTTNLSGTPVMGDFLEVQITDNGTARAITWGTSFAASTVALPTTTVISTLLHVLFEWDSSSSKWVCVATA